MQTEAFKKALTENGIAFVCDEAMSVHTTFRIGGGADLFITPASVEQLALVRRLAAQYGVPCFPLGRGSNLLVSDDGIAGAVVSIGNLQSVTVEENRITAGAGINLSAVCRTARDHALAGMEFAYGIPGSIGGAFFMNAGAYGGEISDIAESALCVDETGALVTVRASEMQFGYRESVFRKNGLWIAAATVKLQLGDPEEITARMEELMERRRAKQPLEYPSAGSAFKRPEGYFAGALIEKNDLKGYAVGDAAVSEKHAGFIINKGSATARDVRQLIEEIRARVYENDGVLLEPEVLTVGREMKG